MNFINKVAALTTTLLKLSCCYKFVFVSFAQRFHSLLPTAGSVDVLLDAMGLHLAKYFPEIPFTSGDEAR